MYVYIVCVCVSVETWMDVEGIMLSKIMSQREKILCNITYTWNLKNQTYRKRVEWWLLRSKGQGK